MSLLSKLAAIQRSIEGLLRANSVPVVKVQKRVKKDRSSRTIKQKAINIPHDLLGLRIIVETRKTCYLVDKVIREKYQIARVRDYITNPWSDGYQSIHIDLVIEDYPVEFQIRTLKMDIIAKKLIKDKGDRYWRDPEFKKS